jgi:2-polyprenyl-6-methoxyphenol hydroxylase-like FAD-dependent oxidoreductase
MTSRAAGHESQPTSPLDVVVIGGGIAGLSSAIALARQGARVELIESRRAAPALPAHLHVVPNLMRELVALGVARECVERAFPYRSLLVTDLAGHRRSEISYAALAGPGFPAAMGMRYDAFVQVLADAAAAVGVTLTRGVEVERLEWAGDVARVVARGESRRPDLVVVAAGADSAARSTLFPAAGPLAALGQSWSYTLVPRPRDLDGLRLMLGAGTGSRRLMLVPIGGRTACLVVMDPADASATSGPVASDAIREFLEASSDFTRGLARHVAPDAAVVKRAVRAGMLDGPWHRGNVVCVGDAAHMMPPQFGQAAAQALEDAVVLGELVATSRDAAAIGPAYTSRRAPRARAVFDIVRQAARWEASPDPSTDLTQLAHRLDEAVASAP